VSDSVRTGPQEQLDRVPFLVIHGEADKSIPLPCGEALFEAASEPKRWLLIPKGNHLLTK
jgi:fermentation-respiration switch protein FrsA (DUF1100 family)